MSKVLKAPEKLKNELIGETLTSVFNGMQKSSLMDITIQLPKLISDLVDQGFEAGYHQAKTEPPDISYDEQMEKRGLFPDPRSNPEPPHASPGRF